MTPMDSALGILAWSAVMALKLAGIVILTVTIVLLFKRSLAEREQPEQHATNRRTTSETPDETLERAIECARLTGRWV